MWEYGIAVENGHLLVLVDGKRALFDTGSPQSIGEGYVEFCGRTYPLAGSAWAGDINVLRDLVGFDFDMLIGGDLLAGHAVDIDPQKGSLTIDDPTPGNDDKSISFQLVMNVPVADVDIAGQEVSAAIDTGARICFAHARLLAQAPRIGEQEDFYPGCGQFTTGLHQSELQLGAYAVSAEVAALPDPLDSQLSTFGIEAIVGNNILLKDRVRIDYARRAIGFAWNINPVH